MSDIVERLNNIGMVYAESSGMPDRDASRAVSDATTEIIRLREELSQAHKANWTASFLDALNSIQRENTKDFSPVNTGPEGLDMLRRLHGQYNSMRTERDKAAENLWVPIGEHPQEWEDGESYLLRVPVCILRPWGAREKTYEFHIVTAQCDDDEPVSFLAANGDPWDLWYWEDADYFIRMEKLPVPCSREDTQGEAQP